MIENPPRKAIRSVEQRPDGVVLRLECGHSMWEAGGRADHYHSAEDGYAIVDVAYCRISPCYKLGRFMGIG